MKPKEKEKEKIKEYWASKERDKYWHEKIRKAIDELGLEKTKLVHSNVVFSTPYDIRIAPTEEKGYFISLDKWEAFKQILLGSAESGDIKEDMTGSLRQFPCSSSETEPEKKEVKE